MQLSIPAVRKPADLGGPAAPPRIHLFTVPAVTVSLPSCCIDQRTLSHRRFTSGSESCLHAERWAIHWSSSSMAACGYVKVALLKVSKVYLCRTCLRWSCRCPGLRATVTVEGALVRSCWGWAHGRDFASSTKGHQEALIMISDSSYYHMD